MGVNLSQNDAKVGQVIINGGNRYSSNGCDDETHEVLGSNANRGIAESHESDVGGVPTSL